MGTPLLDLLGVSKRFVKPLDLAEKIANLFGAGLKEQVVRAVDDVTLSIREGEVVGLVGESGCGKSTLGRIVAGILAPSKGEVRFRGRGSPPSPAPTGAPRIPPCRWCSRTRWPRSIRAGGSTISSARRHSSTGSSRRATSRRMSPG